MAEVGADVPPRLSRTPFVAVIGDGRLETSDRCYVTAFELGRTLVDEGYRLVTGGRRGVMEAASKGGRASERYRPGAVVGILPGSDPTDANEFVDTVICTGLAHARNAIVAQADAVVAVGGGAGTLTELGFAWIHDRLIIGLRLGGWGERLAGVRLDERVRFSGIPEDCVFGARTVREVSILLETYLPRYMNLRAESP